MMRATWKLNSMCRASSMPDAEDFRFEGQGSPFVILSLWE